MNWKRPVLIVMMTPFLCMLALFLLALVMEKPGFTIAVAAMLMFIFALYLKAERGW